MTESSAATKADQLLLTILTNNEQCIGSGYLSSSPANLAVSIAKFREALIQELVKQPD